MWKRMIFLGTLCISLAACNSNKLSDTPESNAPLCEILKQRIEAGDYKNEDPSTTKRKNLTDQAKLVKEYDFYGCPEIIDEAPSP